MEAEETTVSHETEHVDHEKPGTVKPVKPVRPVTVETVS